MFELLAILVGVVVLAGILVTAIVAVTSTFRRSGAGRSTANTDSSPAHGNADVGRGISIRGRFDALGPRAALVAGLALTMSIPLLLVDDLVAERHGLYRGVLSEIAESWGRTQALRGPILVVPFTERHVTIEQIRNDDGEVRTITTPREVRRHAVVLPERLQIAADIEAHHRARGIYQALVYHSELRISGRFQRPDLSALSENIVRIDWDRAYLSVGLSDPRAISKAPELNWSGTGYGWSPGARLGEVVGSGFHAPIDLGSQASSESPTDEPYDFSIALSVAGSGGLYFAPVAERTQATVQSRWPHPSFAGAVLPTTRRVDSEGFLATWDIPHLARSYPQMWMLEQAKFKAQDMFTTGVKLFEPVFVYSVVERAVKYGLLIIIVTYLGLFVFELSAKVRLHGVQYALVGVALALFYLTLLSLSEHVDFVLAYTGAAGIVATMVASYVGLALTSWRSAGVVFTLLGGLYAMLYSLLELEDYALLMGTVLLLVITAVLMSLTRKIAPAPQEDEPVHAGASA